MAPGHAGPEPAPVAERGAERQEVALLVLQVGHAGLHEQAALGGHGRGQHLGQARREDGQPLLQRRQHFVGRPRDADQAPRAVEQAARAARRSGPRRRRRRRPPSPAACRRRRGLPAPRCTGGCSWSIQVRPPTGASASQCGSTVVSAPPSWSSRRSTSAWRRGSIRAWLSIVRRAPGTRTEAADSGSPASRATQRSRPAPCSTSAAVRPPSAASQSSGSSCRPGGGAGSCFAAFAAAGARGHHRAAGGPAGPGSGG